MQITIDDDVFHKWALDRGYVRLTDITEWAGQQSKTLKEVGAAVYVAQAFSGDNFNDQVNAQNKHNPYWIEDAPAPLARVGGDLPDPTDQELTDALTSVLQLKGKPAAMQLLADFDTTSIKRLPEGRAREFMAAAEKAVAS